MRKITSREGFDIARKKLRLMALYAISDPDPIKKATADFIAYTSILRSIEEYLKELIDGE